MRLVLILIMSVFVASCGGGGGYGGGDPPVNPGLPPLPAPLQLSVPGKAVVKVRIASTSGTTVMEERLQPLLHTGGPDRALEIFDSNGAVSGRYSPPAGFSLIDFAQHSTGEITVALATATTVTLARLSRAGAVLDQAQIVDPLAATDRFYDDGGVRDDNSLLPVLTRDAIALAPVGDAVVIGLRTGRNATVAYRYGHTPQTGFTREWRKLVEPGLTVFGIGITSGSFDTFEALENQFHVAIDADDSGRIAVAVPSRTAASRLFAAHADFYSEPIAALEGVLVTRLAADGTRLGTTVVDTVRPSELHGLRVSSSDIALVGRVFTQRRDDGGGWDAYVAHVATPSGALSGYKLVDVDRGDILFDIAPVGDGRYLAVGATGWTQNPDGASVSEQAAPLAVVLDAASTVRSRIVLPSDTRNDQGRSIAVVGTHWLVGGQLNGPGTHSGDGNPAAIAADGFVREVAIPSP